MEKKEEILRGSQGGSNGVIGILEKNNKRIGFVVVENRSVMIYLTIC